MAQGRTRRPFSRDDRLPKTILDFDIKTAAPNMRWIKFSPFRHLSPRLILASTRGEWRSMAVQSVELQRPVHGALRFLPAWQLFDIRYPPLEVRMILER